MHDHERAGVMEALTLLEQQPRCLVARGKAACLLNRAGVPCEVGEGAIYLSVAEPPYADDDGIEIPGDHCPGDLGVDSEGKLQLTYMNKNYKGKEWIQMRLRDIAQAVTASKLVSTHACYS